MQLSTDLRLSLDSAVSSANVISQGRASCFLLGLPPGFPVSALMVFGVRYVFAVWLSWGMFSSISSLYPPEASSERPSQDSENVSRHCQNPLRDPIAAPFPLLS